MIGEPDAWASLPDQPLPDVEIDPDDDATIFYTSGTTGKPKGALATQRNINSNIMAAACAGARAFLRRGETPPAPDPDAPQRATLLSVPFFHATGCFAILNPSLFGGGKLVMMRRWDPVRAFELIERERMTSAGGVPTIAWQLIEHPAARATTTSRRWRASPMAARPRRRSWCARSRRPSPSPRPATAGA